MIISASRRTDIPAYFGDWFLRRLQEGFVLVRNPMNPRQISRIRLERGAVDAFVFWTKNIRPFLPVLEELDRQGFPYFVQYTLNDYPQTIEASLPPLADRLDSLRRLADRVGPNGFMWRYDPILFTLELTAAEHLRRFAGLCAGLDGLAANCTFSFLEEYAKTRRNTRHLDIRRPDQDERRELVARLADIAANSGIRLQCCCGEDYRDSGVLPAACINRTLLEPLVGRPLEIRKDTGQRPNCHCIQSVDIGAYDTCRHGCGYCYANNSRIRIDANWQNYDQQSPILGPPLQSGEIVYERRT